MKLILIYGPPASGKLTVAKELQKITKYKLFHNHLTGDLVSSVFETKVNSKIVFRVCNKIRLDIFETAAKENIDLIFTFVYAPISDKFIKKVIRTINKYRGKVKFVQLSCNQDELRKRVKAPSRKKYQKLKSVSGLNKSLKGWDILKEIPYVKNLKIDNTKLSAKKVAKMIKEHYKLK